MGTPKDPNKYDRQLVVQFLTNTAEDDTILDSTEALADAFWELKGRAKGITGIATIVCGKPRDDGELEKHLPTLTANSRFYLNGHGDWQNQTIGGVGPKETAELLVNAGLTAVKTISIVACELGREKVKTKFCLFQKSCGSFGKKFHARLKEKHGIKCVVYARTRDVGVVTANKGQKLGVLGQKFNITPQDIDKGGEDTWLHHEPYTKKLFTWNGNKQVEDWVYKDDI